MVLGFFHGVLSIRYNRLTQEFVEKCTAEKKAKKEKKSSSKTDVPSLDSIMGGMVDKSLASLGSAGKAVAEKVKPEKPKEKEKPKPEKEKEAKPFEKLKETLKEKTLKPFEKLKDATKEKTKEKPKEKGNEKGKEKGKDNGKDDQNKKK